MTVATSKFKDTEAKKQASGEKVVMPDTEKAYGIRSHLHEFYDWRGTVDSSEVDAWYLIPPSSSASRRRLIYLFRALTVLGLLLLVLGAVLILVGYMWPRESPAAILNELRKQARTEDGQLLVPEDIVNLLEDKMRPWKLAGLVVFACGGTLLAVSLLVPTCARLFGRETLASDLNTPVEPPVKIFPATPPTLTLSSAGDKKTGGSPPSSPTERRVPAIEEITAVQPKSKAGTESGRRASGDEMLLMEEDTGKRP